MKLAHFNFARPTPFAIALSGVTIDDFGTEVRLEGNEQWLAASDFTDDNFFDDSLGFGAGGRSTACI